MRPTLGTVSGDGVTLAAGEWPGGGAPIVALHGITSSLMSFVGVAEALAGARGLYALDLRGHGDSDKPEGPYTIEQQARDVACAMRARDFGPSAIVGHSFGAYVAVALAASAPELVSSLVLVDGGYPPIPSGVHARAFAEMAMAPALARVRQRYSSVGDYVAAWRDLPGLDDGRRDWLEAFAEHDAGGASPTVRSKVAEAAVRTAYHDMVDVGAIEARLSRVVAPVVIVRAQHGAARGFPPIVPDEAVAALRRRVRQTAVVTVDGANHYTIMLAEPGARIVAGVLAEVS
jgi:pimeloyl-ACP methyl ester carboxylesterase